MADYPEPIARVIAELRKLPGIGAKTAQRLTFHLVTRPGADIGALAAAIGALEKQIRSCSRCYSITDIDPCRICSEPGREASLLCVVEQPGDVQVVEETGEYRGLYHVLHGVLDPLAGVGPETLRIEALARRVHEGGVREVILATGTSAEGEATATFLTRRLARPGLRITRPAQGMPAGGELEFTDRLTLARALRGRQPLD
ncbi:MAG: recombination mediator RecR [Acidobacteriota bacterium]